MRYRSLIGTVALAAGLAMVSAAQAFDDAKYPDWKGLWFRSVQGAPRFDTSKPRGLPQQAPLKPEFQKLYEASLADQAAGGQGNHTVFRCFPWGMPAMMNGYGTGIEFIVLPQVTYMMVDDGNDSVGASSPMAGAFPTISSRPSPAIRSASGSIPMVTVPSTRSRSRPACSKGRASTT